ncbi:MAG: hypothetical protein JWM19_6336 [Actinomycetia bacterium]|nr:hypothetical protein [Actinomycetes bacterium]
MITFRYQDSNLDYKDQNLAGCHLPNTGVTSNYPGNLMPGARGRWLQDTVYHEPTVRYYARMAAEAHPSILRYSLLGRRTQTARQPW